MCSPMPLEAPVTTASGGLLSASAFVILSMRSVLSVLPVAAGCALGALIVSPFKAVGLRPYPEGPHLNGARIVRAPMAAAVRLGTNPATVAVGRSTTCRRRHTSPGRECHVEGRHRPAQGGPPGGAQAVPRLPQARSDAGAEAGHRRHDPRAAHRSHVHRERGDVPPRPRAGA